MTQTAVAGRLGLSVSRMKSRVQRGRTRLRAMLLLCCEIETDRRGRVVAFGPRVGNCAGCGTGQRDPGAATLVRLGERLSEAKGGSRRALEKRQAYVPPSRSRNIVTQARVVDDGSRERVELLIPVTTGGFAIPDTGGWMTGGR